jgi:hypothetical protein
MVQYSTLNEMLEPHAISNPIIASYITAYVSRKGNLWYDIHHSLLPRSNFRLVWNC